MYICLCCSIQKISQQGQCDSWKGKMDHCKSLNKPKSLSRVLRGSVKMTTPELHTRYALPTFIELFTIHLMSRVTHLLLQAEFCHLPMMLLYAISGWSHGHVIAEVPFSCTEGLRLGYHLRPVSDPLAPCMGTRKVPGWEGVDFPLQIIDSGQQVVDEHGQGSLGIFNVATQFQNV